MSSNALSASALEKVGFQLFAESVKTHSSSTQFCRQGVPRRPFHTLSARRPRTLVFRLAVWLYIVVFSIAVVLQMTSYVCCPTELLNISSFVVSCGG